MSTETAAGPSPRTRGTDRFDVRASDGVPLAVWVDGNGPPLVLVHGSLADHTTFDPFVAALRPRVTTYAMDRRGFGGSGDRRGYTIDQDFADVAAVVDAVAARTGDTIALFGHSYGAGCAMGGAALTSNVRHLVLYEPGLGLAYRPGQIDELEAALDSGDVERAIHWLLVGILDVPETDFEALREGDRWPGLIAGAPTMVREARVEDAWVYKPGQFDAVAAPTLMLTGSDSTPDIADTTRRAVAAIPGTRLRVLAGHAHLAHKTDPEMVAAVVLDFIGSARR